MWDCRTGKWGFTNFLDQGEYGTFTNPTNGAAYYPDETCAGNGNNAANSGGNAGCQSQWTDEGYGGPVTFPNLIDVTPPVVDGTGLAGNTGFSNSTGWRAAMDGLVDDIIQLPVATRYNEVNGPDSDRLNVTGVVSLRVCSINRGGTVTEGTHSECNGIRQPTAVQVPDWTTLANNEAAIWGIPTDFVTSGVAGGPRTGCFGNPNCDFGTRAVRLYK